MLTIISEESSLLKDNDGNPASSMMICDLLKQENMELVTSCVHVDFLPKFVSKSPVSISVEAM